MAIPLADYLLRGMRKASPESEILVPSVHRPPGKAVDWNAVVLDMIHAADIGPSDFEKEYLCDMASMGALPSSTFTSTPTEGSISTYGPVTTTASTAAVGPAMSADSLMKAIEKVIGGDKMKRIIEETIGEVGTGQEIAEKVEPARENPVFGSW